VRLSMLVGLCLLSTAPLAGQPSPEAMKAEIANPWGVEFTRTTGEWSRIFGHPSRKACEAAIPQVLAKQSGYNGHCVYHDLSTARILGTQDPAWIAENERMWGWSVEFIGPEGKWARRGGLASKATCEAIIHELPKDQGGDGHCVHGEWKDGDLRFIGSQDPALR